MSRQVTEADAKEQPVEQPRPGELLLQAREQQQISLQAVSERIKVSVAQLQALEEDAIERLPGLAFARGYLRTYARFLGIDDDQLIERFNQLHGSSTQNQVATINRVKKNPHAKDPMVRGSVLLLLVIVVGSTFWWWQSQTGNTARVSAPSLDKARSTEPAQAQPLPASNGPVDPAPVSSAAEEHGAAESTVEPGVDQNEHAIAEDEPRYLSEEEIARLAKELEQADTHNEGAQTETAAPASTQTTSTESDVGEALLLVRFSADCWVSLKNRDGKVVFANLMKAGDSLERSLTGLPVELLIGQTSAVASAQFRGQALSIAEASRKGVARLRLE